MEKTLKSHFKQTLIAYVVIYFIYSFSVFNLENPFQWIIELDTYRDEERLGILLSFMAYHFISIFMWNEYYKKIHSKKH